MIKKILFLFFVVFAATAYSQDVTITGTVTDVRAFGGRECIGEGYYYGCHYRY